MIPTKRHQSHLPRLNSLKRHPVGSSALKALVMQHEHINFQRFVDAQEAVYPDALSEIRRGAKRGHWMWFIFPQATGLGRSEMARRFEIGSRQEASAYLAHPILGTRLRECVESLQDLTNRTAMQVFGEVDALKLRSSLALFSVAGGGPLFDAALSRWFGSPDVQTLDTLGKSEQTLLQCRQISSDGFVDRISAISSGDYCS